MTPPPKTIILAATTPEAKAIQNALTILSGESFVYERHARLWRGKTYQIQITGIGPEKVAHTLSLLNTYTPMPSLINIGCAAALRTDFPRTLCREVARVRTSDEPWMTLTPYTPPPHFSLLSVDKTVEDVRIAERYAQETGADILDMEGAYIAQYAQQKHMQCRIIKIISDYADTDARTTFFATLAHAEEAWHVACTLAYAGHIT